MFVKLHNINESIRSKSNQVTYSGLLPTLLPSPFATAALQIFQFRLQQLLFLSYCNKGRGMRADYELMLHKEKFYFQ